MNVSRPWSTAALRFHSGRLWGALRAKRNRWSIWRRIVYIVGGPLIPLVRLRRYYNELKEKDLARELVPRILPALLFALVFDGLGQMCGYALGSGGSSKIVPNYEFNRLAHMTSADRNRLAR